MFLIDLILGFFTTFITKKGYKETDSAKIYHNLTGKTIFYTDFLSICGNSLFQNLISPHCKNLQMFKLFRLFKIHNMIITSNISKLQKTYAIISKLFLYLILWFHILACGWWVVLGINAN